jgi:Bacterial PH domain
VDNARSWAPAIGLVVVAWLGAAAALALLMLTDDAPGRLLAGIAVLGLAAIGLFGSVARPRLAVDEERVAVCGLTGTRSWPWQQVHRVRVVRHRRLGRDIPMLELDVLNGEERLIVLGRFDLNADPDDVHDQIQQVRGLT